MKERLFEYCDEKYGDFHAKLIPNISRERIIGVRTPVLRKLAKEVPPEFLKELPHYYYEENNLHAFAIERIKDYDACLRALDEFLPFVDNWATCDSMSPKALKKYPERTALKAREWLSSNHTYTVRFGMGVLMGIFADELFSPEYLSWVSGVKSEEYYVMMMQAWYFATLLAKQWDAAIPYIKEYRLSKWVHNKTISKACESFRITPEQKAYLKTLKL